MDETTTASWNCSTMCLQTLHSAMAKQRWDSWQPATPLRDGDFPPLSIEFTFELPRRPLDLGVGLWR